MKPTAPTPTPATPTAEHTHSTADDGAIAPAKLHARFSRLPRAVQVLAGVCVLGGIAVAVVALVYASDRALLSFDPIAKLFGLR